ncbi:MAG: UTP--glucose-1-phosphate uridylyltransferase, partial [Thermoanaerobacterium sp.]|nr:UTP--glucose-1-phosphate uridylyltransferase [Thermoanaerobacterium sp.]
VNSGIEDILIITGRNKRAIEDHFDKSVELELELKKKGKENLLNLVEDITNMVDIHYIRQKEPKGLGHAIYCAHTFVGNEPFAVLLGDDIVDSKVPVLKQMIEQYERYNCTIIGVQEVPKSEVDKYGIVDANMINDRLYRVNNLIEKPRVEESPSNMAILGRYIISPKIFEILKDIKPGAGGEIQLTDALKVLLDYEAIYAYNFEGKRYDVGDKMGYLKATIEYALKRDDLKDEFRKYLTEIVNTYDDCKEILVQS